ncbi:MAG TPA: polysaccharide biosynthesis tyrosine autokinase [Candidatus Binataceae bacterium]|nr:polysaccharide biosynthesis tyrosine autokinase [Candidatus Binataceae bacterium]
MANEPSPYFISRNGQNEAAIDTSYHRTFEEDERTLDLLNYWITFKKHRWLIGSVTAAVVVIVAIRVAMMTPLYTATSTILLRPGTPQILQNHAGESDNQSTSDFFDPDTFIKTQSVILKSRTLAASVIQDEGLTSDPVFLGRGKTSPSLLKTLKYNIAAMFGIRLARPAGEGMSSKPIPVNRLIGAYLGSLEIKPIPDTELVRIIFTTPNPQLSAKLANAHARAYIREGIELRRQANAEAEQFLRSKLVELKEKLEKSELALNSYRREKGIVPGLMSMDGKDTVVLDRLTELSREITSAQVARIGLEAQVQQIAKHGYIDIPTPTGAAGTDSVKNQLNATMADYAAMAQKFKPDYPPLRQLKARLDELQRDYSQELAKRAAIIKAEYQAAQTKEDELQTELNQERTQALGLNDAAVEYAILRREVDTNRDLYNSVLQRMKDVGLAAESQSSNIVVVDEAQPPGAPSSPHRMVDILQAIAFGLALGIALAFLIEYQDKTLKTPDQVEIYLHLPNLAAVPAFWRPESRTFTRNMRKRLDPASKSGSEPEDTNGKPAHVANGSLLPSHRRELAGTLNRYSVIGEAYRTLRTALMLSRAGAAPKTILFTSASNSEGKTVSSLNTALVFAHTGVKVLLVDVDLRRPRCHKVLGMDNTLGLSQVLAGARVLKDVIRSTDIDSLWLLASGSVPPNPSELVGSEKMRETLNELVSQFDIVILDSPPILPVTDGILLSTMVDGVVLVVNSSKTAKQHVRAACAKLAFARAKVFGVLLNEVDVNSQHYQYYRRYYGSYDTYHPYSSDFSAEESADEPADGDLPRAENS